MKVPNYIFKNMVKLYFSARYLLEYKNLGTNKSLSNIIALGDIQLGRPAVSGVISFLTDKSGIIFYGHFYLQTWWPDFRLNWRYPNTLYTVFTGNGRRVTARVTLISYVRRDILDGVLG